MVKTFETIRRLLHNCFYALGMLFFFIFESFGSAIQGEFQTVLESFILKHTLGAVSVDTGMPTGMCLSCKTKEKFMNAMDVSEDEYHHFVEDFKEDVDAFQDDITSVNDTFEKSIVTLLELIDCKEKELLEARRTDPCFPLYLGPIDDLKSPSHAIKKLKEENCKRAISSWSNDCALLYKQKEFNILLAQKIFMQTVTRKCFDINKRHYNEFYNKGDAGVEEIGVKLQNLTDDMRNMHINALQAKVHEDTIDARLRALQGVTEHVIHTKGDNEMDTDHNDCEEDMIPLMPVPSM